MNTYRGASLPYGTANAPLAFALYLAGVPFADEKSPLTNIYDADTLRKLGFGGDVEKAAQQAFAAGHRGHVEYGFRTTNDLGLVTKAFDQQQKALQASGESAAALVQSIHKDLVAGILAPAEAIAKAACVVLKRWREELKEWEKHKAFTTRRNENRTHDYEGPELAQKIFLSGDFYAFAAVLMDYRTEFLALYRMFPPIIRLKRGSQVTKHGDRQKFPGSVIYSTNSERETRRHLGVPTL